MKNFEYYSPESRNALVLRYALRGVVDERGAYRPEDLLKAQYRVYGEWLARVNKGASESRVVGCTFYEWMLRSADVAFVVKPGDLVKYKGAYCIVKDRTDPSWCNSWQVVAGAVQRTERPQQYRCFNLGFPDGRVICCDADDRELEPADIPPEVFALACSRAKDCPMMKGGAA